MADVIVENKASQVKKMTRVSEPTPPIKKIFVVSLVVILLLFPLLQFVKGGMNYWLHMLLYTFMYISMASSWNIIGGYAGYTSLFPPYISEDFLEPQPDRTS